ncbi:hypothetical protein PFLUV_G00220490 [Perca fluviatilis]|uniref:Uncharacterized protein n=1 Tax=Perca fluviatilis TaxID=8168 RepID=A0A6A5DZB1_PERFL|nr:hypothetical protein PFLUV_G00220490 [Perca fluviatilis]
MDYLLSFEVSWPHLTGAERRSASALLPFPAAVQKTAPEGARVSACSAGAPTALCFMHHRFNKHRQHPRRSPLPILPAERTKLFPLLSSPPNPRLYQLSIKKIQLQFGIRQNTLITKVRLVSGPGPRGGGVSGSGLSRLPLRAHRPPPPSVRPGTRADWLKEADPQVSSAHRGAGRREDFLLLDTFTAARLLRPESSGEGKRNKTSDLDRPPVPSSCSIGGNRTTGLSWVEQ